VGIRKQRIFSIFIFIKARDLIRNEQEKKRNDNKWREFLQCRKVIKLFKFLGVRSVEVKKSRGNSLCFHSCREKKYSISTKENERIEKETKRKSVREERVF
jgi:hypothetical protein